MIIITLMVKNNVTRYLDGHGIEYTCYEVPELKLGGIETAHFLDIDPNLVYKTIVAVREHGKPILAVVPSTGHVNLKKLAQFLGEKKLSLPSEKEAERLTGLQAGGISPLALLNKGFRVVIDQLSSAQTEARIHISGGQRGLNIKISMKDLVAMTNAHVAPISDKEPA